LVRLILFGAAWSSPGDILAPVARRVAASFGLPFVAVDVEKEPEVIGRFALRTLPEMVLTDGTSVLWRLAGLVSEYELRRTIRELLTVESGHQPV